MRIWTLALILAASCFAADDREAPPPAGTPKPFVLPGSNTFTLKNGMKVTLAQHGSVPVAAVGADCFRQRERGRGSGMALEPPPS